MNFQLLFSAVFSEISIALFCSSVALFCSCECILKCSFFCSCEFVFKCSFFCSCVVTGRSFYVSLFAPIIIVITVNVFILVRVMYSLSKSPSLNSKSSNIRKGRIWFSCACLLGLSWVFGVFSVATSSLVFQYLFCICASFQGFFLFFFNCVLNKEVKLEVIKTLSRYIPASIWRKESNVVDCEPGT